MYNNVIKIDANTGVLSIINFDNKISLSKIFVQSSLGTSNIIWSDDTNNLATLEIIKNPEQAGI